MLRALVDGSTVLHSLPEDRHQDGGVVILLDGLGGTKESLKICSKAFREDGHAVVLADNYNEGERRNRLVEPLSNREGWRICQKANFWKAIWTTAQDVPFLIDFAIATYGTDKIAAYGQSMGGDILLTSLVFEHRLQAVVTECSTPDWMRPNSENNVLGDDEDGDRLYREKCPWNNVDAFKAHPTALLLINGEHDRHVPAASAEAFVKNLNDKGYYPCEERLQYLCLPSCGSQGHAIQEDAVYRASDFITSRFSAAELSPCRTAVWQSFMNEDGGEAWAVWELLKGHCKSEDSWDDAKTEAGMGDTVYEGEEDDFDDDDFVWELLRDDCDDFSEDSIADEDEDEETANKMQEGGSSASTATAPGHADVKHEFVEDLLDSEEDVDELMASVSALSETVFDFDCIKRAFQRDWIVTALTEVGSDGVTTFCGFICYVAHPSPRAELNVKLLAVSRELKGRGHGTILMKWLLAKASRMPESECRWLTVSAWESAVSFYERFGFCDFGSGGGDADEDEDEEEQFWMELKNCPINEF